MGRRPRPPSVRLPRQTSPAGAGLAVVEAMPGVHRDDEHLDSTTQVDVPRRVHGQTGRVTGEPCPRAPARLGGSMRIDLVAPVERLAPRACVVRDPATTAAQRAAAAAAAATSARDSRPVPAESLREREQERERGRYRQRRDDQWRRRRRVDAGPALSGLASRAGGHPGARGAASRGVDPPATG